MLIIGKFVKKVSILSLTFWIVSCGKSIDTGSAISQLVPLALRGDANFNQEYTEPGSNINNSIASSSSPVILYQADEVATVCAGGIKEPGNNFGLNGPEAFMTFCSDSEVDRYRNIEIRFSESMDKTSVENAFSMNKEGGSLPGPSPGGTFIWKSPRRMYFDPYRELSSLSDYTITISTSAQTVEGKSLKSFTKNFKASHDYLMISTITQGGTTITLNQEKDITFNKTNGNLVLNSSWVNSAGIDSTVSKIVLNKIGNTVNGVPNSSAKSICEGGCNGNPISINLSTDTDFQNSPLSITEGGNTYYYEITTLTGNKYQRFFSFNWGNVTDPNNLINNVAAGVLDEGQMMRMLERLIEVFAEGKFKVTNKTFNEFAQTPVSSARNTTKCIDYKNGNFNYISTYGDNPSGGYCGPDGNEGRFVGTYNGILTLWSDSHFDMDVYVTNVSLPGTTNGNPTVDALMKVNGNGEIGVDLGSRKAFVSLAVIARNRTNIALLIPGGSRFYFTTTIELNKSPTATNIRNARSKAGLSVNGSGDLSLFLNSLQDPPQKDDPNFIITEWVDNLAVGGMNLEDSTSWAADLLAPITEMIANGLVPQVKTAITQNMLKDILQKVAPNVLNAIVGTLKNPGIEITLPPYLPPPLANYPLSVKVQLSNDGLVRSDGINKGIVASVHAGLTAKTPLSAGSQRQHANTSVCSGNGCMVYTKDPSNPLIPVSTSAPFSESHAHPGFLLSMHSDSVTQAAYHLWKNRAIDLNVDSAFISTVNSYAGDDPLLKLTDSILKVSAITAIIAPGRSVLFGLDTNNNLLPAVCANDDVRFKIDPLMSPVARMVNNVGFDPSVTNLTQPNLNVIFSDLQLTIQGKRTDISTTCTSKRGAADNSYYTLATLKVSMNANAAFRIVEFNNPNTTENEYQNGLNLKVFTSGLAYSLDVLEGPVYNPYGLDPAGIKSVFDPLVTTLVVPLVNSILNRLPLPSEVPFAALNKTNSTAACMVSAKRDNAIQINSLPVPATDSASNPYIYAQVELKGNTLTDPKNLLEEACR